MITDIFLKRYPKPLISAAVPAGLATAVRQAALIFKSDVAPYLLERDAVFRRAHDKLVRELGVGELSTGSTAVERCLNLLWMQYDLWNDSHGSADTFAKVQLSMIELLFREANASVQGLDKSARIKTKRLIFGGQADLTERSADVQQKLHHAVAELNDRLREAHVPFEYHNGMLQRRDDTLTSDQIDTPFWGLVADPKWKVVDADMKEAIDRRDSSRPDAATYSMKALESTLKIISSETGRTRGSERGAAAYIDNLAAKRPSRFIDVWEAEALKILFKYVRNPLSHGPGNEPAMKLSSAQTTLVIESAMSWIKSLVRRDVAK